MRIRLLVTLFVAFLIAALPLDPAHAARHFPPGKPPGNGSGRIVSVLPDGTIREACIDRAETFESSDSLARRRVTWDVGLVGVSTNRLGTIDQHGLGVGGVGVSVGLGGDAIASIRGDGWDRTRLDASGGDGSIDASGLGTTTIALKKAFRSPASADSESAAGTTFGVGALVRLAGSAQGPGPSRGEWGATFVLDRAFGDRTHIALGANPGWVGNAADSGHHFETAAGLVVSEEIARPLSLWLEAVSVSSNEPQRPWLGVLDAGLRLEAWSHVDLTVGAAAGRGGGRADTGAFARVGIHS